MFTEVNQYPEDHMTANSSLPISKSIFSYYGKKLMKQIILQMILNSVMEIAP